MRVLRRGRGSSRPIITLAAIAVAASFPVDPRAQERPVAPANPPAKRIITQGLATQVIDNLFKCETQVSNHRVSAVGTITAKEGGVLTVPAETDYQTGPKLADLFNECSKVTPRNFSEAKIDDVPIVEIDKDGEAVTGFIIADNYFQLYVNGRLVGVDAVTYTPFNSSIVRFRVKRPYTYAFLLVLLSHKAAYLGKA